MGDEVEVEHDRMRRVRVALVDAEKLSHHLEAPADVTPWCRRDDAPLRRYAMLCYAMLCYATLWAGGKTWAAAGATVRVGRGAWSGMCYAMLWWLHAMLCYGGYMEPRRTVEVASDAKRDANALAWHMT